MRRLAWFGLIALTTVTGFPLAAVAATPASSVRYAYVLFHDVEESERVNSAVITAPQIRSGALRLSGSLDQPVLQPSVHVIEDAEYPAPDRTSLHYFGRGISSEQAARLQSMRTTVLVFSHPRASAVSSIAHTDALALFAAEQLDALLWDDEIRLLYSVEAWNSARIQGQDQSLPSALRRTTIHAYRNGDHMRAVTLGMAKFGAPDLVAERLAWSNQGGIGKLIVAACQALIEGARGEQGRLDLDLRAIRDDEVGKFVLEDVPDAAPARLSLELVAVEPQDGDAHNALRAIEFAQYAGKDEFARQVSALTTVYPAKREVYAVDPNAQLELASRRAREQFESLRSRFDGGLAPEEHLMVKAPFETDGGSVEWMWVEVLKWDGDAIAGLLQNDPVDISGLDAGQQVTVRQQDIFDYLHALPDGRAEGNKTAEIILEMQRKAAREK